MVKPNSPEMLETGRGLLDRHGSWDAVKDASVITPDGVYAVDVDPKAVDAAIERLDPEKRAAEKQARRDKDDQDLRDGKVTPEILRKRNGFFSGLDLSKATIRFRKKR